MSTKKVIVTMFVVFGMVILSSQICSAQDVKAKAKIVITSPSNDSEVGLEYLVRGKVSNYSSGNVYVLVHPLKTNLVWVQRPPSGINEDGAWQTLCYFGTETQGKGEYFEIIAILSITTLQEGKTFTITNLPKNIIKSPIITVKRTK